MAHGESFIADSCSSVNSGYEGVRSTWNWCGVGGYGVFSVFGQGKNKRKQLRLGDVGCFCTKVFV